MGNVLRREKREQVIALGQLGWTLRRIEEDWVNAGFPQGQEFERLVAKALATAA